MINWDKMQISILLELLSISSGYPYRTTEPIIPARFGRMWLFSHISKFSTTWYLCFCWRHVKYLFPIFSCDTKIKRNYLSGKQTTRCCGQPFWFLVYGKKPFVCIENRWACSNIYKPFKLDRIRCDQIWHLKVVAIAALIYDSGRDLFVLSKAAT